MVLFTKFKGQNIFEFMEHFPDEDSCKSYLAHYKWKDGFSCPRCGCILEHNSSEPYTKRCKGCLHKESATSGTLFHKLKFDLRKAFYIVFELSTTTKGSSSLVLSKKLGINQKTAWKFSRKVRLAMESSKQYPLEGQVEVDETFIGGEDKESIGRNPGKKTPIIVAIEKTTQKEESDEDCQQTKIGIKRAYAQVIENTSSQELRKIFDAHISEDTDVLTDKWTGYLPLMKEWDIILEKSKGGENFELIHHFIMGLKSWIRGIFHKVRPEHLQKYLDEYCYRFNRSIHKNTIFDNFIIRMIKHKPTEYKSFR